MEIPTTTNFHRLKKVEVEWLYDHYCKHNHRYSEHPKCFLEEYGDRLATIQRVVTLDIETTNLAADFGYILCYSMKDLDGDIIHRSITTREIKTYKFDEPLMRQFLKDIKGVDKVITYYGSGFDLPYLRSRALRFNLPFPGWRELVSVDVYYIARAKLRTHRKRLEVVADLMGIPSKGHRLNPEVWQRAQAGSKQALDYIQTHCDEDVVTLEAVYERLIDFRSENKTSI